MTEPRANILRRNRNAESVVIPSSQYSPLAVSAAGVYTYGTPNFIPLKETYCNCVTIVAFAHGNITTPLGNVVVRLSLRNDQNGPAETDVLIPFDAAGGSLPIPLFCHVFAVAVHEVTADAPDAPIAVIFS